MKIVSLQTENVKRLKVVNITPSGSAIIIGGDNGQGKSSVLDSIFMGLAVQQRRAAQGFGRDGDRHESATQDSAHP